MTKNEIKFSSVNGAFKQRGDESIKYIPSLAEFAQEHFIRDILLVGYSGQYKISVVNTYTENGADTLQMVKHGIYDMMDFASDEDLKAYNNMNSSVVRALGVYSNKFKVGAGYKD